MKQIGTVLLACLVASGCRDQPTSGVKMHRVQAGKPDQSGWITANSTFGCFSVRVPIPFNDFTVQEADPTSVTLKVEVVGCKSTEGIKFSASKIFYKVAGTSVKQFEKMKLGGGIANATVALAKASGHEAVDMTVGDSSIRAKQRTILVGEQIYVLIVEWPVQQEALAESLVPTFFDSFNICEYNHDVLPAPCQPPPTVRSTESGTPSGPVYYRVQAGDDLYAVAIRFGCSVSELKKVNGLTSSDLSVGHLLEIPLEDTKNENKTGGR